MTTFHCFYCDNIDKRMLALHQEAAAIVGMDVQYCCVSLEEIHKKGLSPHAAHGWFMEETILSATSSVIGFIDVDCIPASSAFLEKCEADIKKTGTIVGAAQSANHLSSRNQIYAAPAFMLISTSIWHDLDRPSLQCRGNFDTAQELSLALDNIGKPFTILMPESYTNLGPVWNLGGKPGYGIGTIYDHGNLFHLFCSASGPSYLSLYEEKVEQLRQGKFSFLP